MKNNSVRKIVLTAMFIALLVVLQFAVGKFGIQLLTGSVVNFVLIASVMFGGIGCGCVVAVLSPVMAYLLAVAPLASVFMLPAVMLGNVALVIMYHFLFKFEMPRVKSFRLVNWIVAIVASAVVKFGILWLAMVKISVPLIGLPDAAVAKISVAFGATQLLTALIGGVIALAIVPTLQYATRKK